MAKNDIAMAEINSLLFLTRHLLMLKKLIAILGLAPKNTTDGTDLSISTAASTFDDIDPLLKDILLMPNF